MLEINVSQATGEKETKFWNTHSCFKRRTREELPQASAWGSTI